jgi:chromosome segregation ATPase
MRFAALLLLTFLPLSAQSNDSKTLETLLGEVRELRLAIERSTLLGTRAQLALGELQLQDAAAARAGQQYNDVKSAGIGSALHVTELTDRVKRLEEQRAAPEWSSQQKHDDIENMIRQTKSELEMATSYEQQRSAREAELATQLRNAQAQADDSRSRIAQMEAAIDAAIQQMLKPKQ